MVVVVLQRGRQLENAMDPAGPRSRHTHDLSIGYADIEKCEKQHLPSSYALPPHPQPDDNLAARLGPPGDHWHYKAAPHVFLQPERTWKWLLSDMLFWPRYSSWALPTLLTFCLVLLTWPLTTPSRALVDPPRRTTGYSDVVQWDNYTLWIHNQRVFLQ